MYLIKIQSLCLQSFQTSRGWNPDLPEGSVSLIPSVNSPKGVPYPFTDSPQGPDVYYNQHYTQQERIRPPSASYFLSQSIEQGSIGFADDFGVWLSLLVKGHQADRAPRIIFQGKGPYFPSLSNITSVKKQIEKPSAGSSFCKISSAPGLTCPASQLASARNPATAPCLLCSHDSGKWPSSFCDAS